MKFVPIRLTLQSWLCKLLFSLVIFIQHTLYYIFHGTLVLCVFGATYCCGCVIDTSKSRPWIEDDRVFSDVFQRKKHFYIRVNTVYLAQAYSRSGFQVCAAVSLRWLNWTETRRLERLCRRSASGWTWSELSTASRRRERVRRCCWRSTSSNTANASTPRSASTPTQVSYLMTFVHGCVYTGRKNRSFAHIWHGSEFDACV